MDGCSAAEERRGVKLVTGARSPGGPMGFFCSDFLAMAVRIEGRREGLMVVVVEVVVGEISTFFWC